MEVLGGGKRVTRRGPLDPEWMKDIVGPHRPGSFDVPIDEE